MARKKVEESTDLQVITDTQQNFIQALLTGKSIKEAAILAGVSRRSATYWMMSNNPVRLEYETQRLALKEQFYSRIARLHGLALQAMEDSLSPDAPPIVRFNAAKYLYEAHLQRYSSVAWPADADDLAQAELHAAREKTYSTDASYLNFLE